MSSVAAAVSPSDAAVRALLAKVKRIAVVGYSSNSSRPSNHVAAYMAGAGYDIVGVNPAAASADSGIRLAASLAAAEELHGGSIEIVDVFRKPDALKEVLDDVDRLKTKPACVWLQEGVTNADVEAALRSRGILVVSDRCLLKEHQRLISLASSL